MLHYILTAIHNQNYTDKDDVHTELIKRKPLKLSLRLQKGLKSH